MNEWRNFKEGTWCNEINVSDFIKNNYEAYDKNDIKEIVKKGNKKND